MMLMGITSRRLMVRLTERQENALDREAERLGIPVPEVIRRWLDERIDLDSPKEGTAPA